MPVSAIPISVELSIPLIIL